ncbi:MAG TPA: twin-arginine translocase TatA/TatE family subunit [Solirubrobacteraceae bacterium]|jgi:TatA/E family protein of Tat protein translocase
MGIENPVHLLFIAAVALVVLGPKRLPELARSLGKGIREFRESISDGSTTGAPHVPVAQSPPAAPIDATVVAPPPEGAAAAPIDPPEPVRSGDHAPDSRSL